MRFIVLLLSASLLPALAGAQERWQRMPAGASAFHVDLESLRLEQNVLHARVQTSDAGSVVQVQEVEVRCGSGQLRTTARLSYDSDTGRLVPAQSDTQADTLWVGYPRGSEGHALLYGLCQLNSRMVPHGNPTR